MILVKYRTHFTTPLSRGFSLIEIIAALAIMGIALAGLLRLHLSSVTAADKAAGMVQATLLAEAKLNTFLEAGDASSLPLSGMEQYDSVLYQWNTIVGQEHPAGWPMRKPLQRIDIQVSWGQGRARQQIELSTYKAREKAP
jgi:general secretion pathway protein I